MLVALEDHLVKRSLPPVYSRRRLVAKAA
jgi:hypothetical protein